MGSEPGTGQADPPGRWPVTLHLGEIHTGILQSSTPIPSRTARAVLATLPHQTVRTWERPIRRAVSPEVLTGLDLHLPTASGTQVRAIGTAATGLRVTHGRLLQSCTRTLVVPSVARRRLAWSYYLARPGALEAVGRLVPQDVSDGFLNGAKAPFDLGVVCSQWMDWAQSSAELDHRGPFSAPRLRLRWAASAGAPARVTVRVHDDRLRTVRIVAPEPILPAVADFCEDLALHDWLLSTLLAVIDTATGGRRDRAQVIERLQPAVDHLLSAWMPLTPGRDDLAPYWAAVEHSSGLTSQWNNAVRAVRDQVALAAALPRALRRTQAPARQPVEQAHQ